MTDINDFKDHYAIDLGYESWGTMIHLLSKYGVENILEHENKVMEAYQKKEQEEKFTIEEFRNYLESQDSFGDALYFLNADKVKQANETEEEEEF